MSDTQTSPPPEDTTTTTEQDDSNLASVALDTIAKNKQEGKLYLALLIAYFVLFLFTFIIMKKCSKFDVVFGFLTKQRQGTQSLGFMKCLFMTFLLWLFGMPIAFAIYGYQRQYEISGDFVRSASFAATVIVSSFFLHSIAAWYGMKWFMGRLTIWLLSFSLVLAWLFALIVLYTSDHFSYTGASAILYATNFLPTIYIIYQKKIRTDIPIFPFFKQVAKRIVNGKREAARNGGSVARKQQEMQLDHLVEELSKQGSMAVLGRILLVFIGYVAPLVLMSIIMYNRLDDDHKTLGIVNSCFLFLTDLIFFTIRQQTIETGMHNENGKSYFIYEQLFQVLVALLVRIILSYNYKYWLISYSIIYLMVQTICALDVSQNVLIYLGIVRDEQEDIIELYRKAPLLMARTMQQIPELRTFMPQEKKKSCLEYLKIVTRANMWFVYLLGFVTINVLHGKEILLKETVKITFWNKFGQEVFGYLAIFFTVLVTLYILWFRLFKYQNYKFGWLILIIYVVLQGVSVGFGFIFYKVPDKEINLILTFFICIPIITISFASWAGIWISNDYAAYEYSYVKSMNFKPSQIAAFNKLSTCRQLLSGAWKPQTGKDHIFFWMLILNFVSLIGFTVWTALWFKPVYVGITIGSLIFVFEMTFIMLNKYKESEYLLSPSVLASGISGFSIMAAWFVYACIEIVFKEDQPQIFKTATILTLIIYVAITTAFIMYIRLKAMNFDFKRMKIGFFIPFVIVYLALIGIGVALIATDKNKIFGIIWISIIIYATVDIVFFKYKLLLDILFALIYIIAGCISFYVDSEVVSNVFQGINILFAGLFIISFGSFCTRYFANHKDKQFNIFMQTTRVFPMLKYNLKTKEMQECNQEPFLFLLFIFSIFLWSFISTGLVAEEKRHVPLSIMSMSLAISFIYIVDKNTEASSIDNKLFSQGTYLFYAGCLTSATEYKLKWRNMVRGQEKIHPDWEPQYNDTEENPEVQVSEAEVQKLVDPLQAADRIEQEMTRSKAWRKMLGHYRDTIGCYSIFESVSVSDNMRATARSQSQVCAENEEQYQLKSDQSGATQTPEDSTAQSCVNTPDEDIRKWEAKMKKWSELRSESESNNEKFFDMWLELRNLALSEVSLEIKFWAFLNGYSVTKMKGLLKLQSSIIDTVILLFFKNLRNEGYIKEDEVDEHITIGKFMLDLELNPVRLIQFNKYLMETFIKDTQRMKQRINKVKGNVDDQHNIQDILNNATDDPSAFKKIQYMNDNIDREYGNSSVPAKFQLDKFLKDLTDQIDHIANERAADMSEQIELMKQRDEERMQQRIAAMEAREALEELKVPYGDVIIPNLEEEGTRLKVKGDEDLRQFGLTGNQCFEDVDFDEMKATQGLENEYKFMRIEKVISNGQSMQNEKNVVFAEGTSACDVRQGGLGNCFFLSAMSVLAHSRPDLLKECFHPESQKYREDGLYTIRMFFNKKPVIITIDDRFKTDPITRQHAFVQLKTLKNGEREIWPLLIEKAYAKMNGGYANIEGGLVSKALQCLTNGIPINISMKDEDTEQQFNTGELWTQMKFYRESGYLMGAGSPSGVDTETSDLGIVQGHAYSILDVAEIDGHNLIQLRNPWGDEVEWSGAWGDKSKQWTDRRKRLVYERMEKMGAEKLKIGLEDGTFWMEFGDFFSNFDDIYVCRLFDNSWATAYVDLEWSKNRMNAGGCMNYGSFTSNPQMLLHVQPNVEGYGMNVFIELAITSEVNKFNKPGMGFQLYPLEGKQMDKRNKGTKKAYQNDRGYKKATNCSFDGIIKAAPGGHPYTLIASTFEPNCEFKFRISVYYKKQQGNVTFKGF